MSAPSVVAIGGGHGLAATLRAARLYAGQITAVVSIADDGGSSGRLREVLQVPAPGDIRRCLAALADDDSMLGAALEHRFEAGELAGHPLGNLLIAGLAEAGGDFVEAVAEVGRLVGAVGTVLPAAVEPVVLKAESSVGTVEGQVEVQDSSGIRLVTLVPPNPRSSPAAVEAIAAADQIVLGPGSLYTSVIAAVLVPDIQDAVMASSAQRVYVANLECREPETEGYTTADCIDALRDHGVRADVVLCHPAQDACEGVAPPCVERPLATADGRAHDPALLADALRELAVGTTGKDLVG